MAVYCVFSMTWGLSYLFVMQHLMDALASALYNGSAMSRWVVLYFMEIYVLMIACPGIIIHYYPRFGWVWLLILIDHIHAPITHRQTSKQIAKVRLSRFFSSLYAVLKRTSRAALQFYPESPDQAILISSCAAAAGFAGGLVVDYPNSTKAKKHYLVLSFDKTYKAPKGRVVDAGGGRNNFVQVLPSCGKRPSRKVHKSSGRDWVIQKKMRCRRQGKTVRPDTKYTGRKRKDKF